MRIRARLGDGEAIQIGLGAQVRDTKRSSCKTHDVMFLASALLPKINLLEVEFYLHN